MLLVAWHGMDEASRMERTDREEGQVAARIENCFTW